MNKYRVHFTKELPFDENDVVGVLTSSVASVRKTYELESLQSVLDTVNAILATSSDAKVRIEIEKI